MKGRSANEREVAVKRGIFCLLLRSCVRDDLISRFSIADQLIVLDVQRDISNNQISILLLNIIFCYLMIQYDVNRNYFKKHFNIN